VFFISTFRGPISSAVFGLFDWHDAKRNTIIIVKYVSFILIIFWF